MTVITAAMPAADAFDWETLVTGMLAVGAAWVAIGQTSRFEQKRLWRESNAARMTLPLVLDEITDWCMTFTQALLELMAESDADNAIPVAARQAFRRPDIPEKLIPDLKDVLRATQDEVVIERIALMVQKMQVVTSRVDDMSQPTKVVVRETIASHLTEVLIIHAQANSLFDYARRRSETAKAKLAWKDVLEPLVLLAWDTKEAADLTAYVKRFEAHGVAPEFNKGPR